MPVSKHRDTPFPLKQYYLVYGGIGSILFYVLLFMLFIHAERKALYNEYTHSVSEKARSMYLDIERDFLKLHGISIEQVDSLGAEAKGDLRLEIEEIVTMDFSLAKVKLFRADAMTLYDHSEPENEGRPYTSQDEVGFISALQGNIASEIEVESDGRRLMEAYLPIKRKGTDDVVAVLEIYEDVSRFERQVQDALKEALILPTIVFVIFNIVLFLIVAKADKIIAKNTNLLVAIRRNMEKYLSQSAVTAIYQAVSEKKELFRGERQALVVLFSDIRSFTSYSETTEPENVVHTLNSLFQIQAEILYKYGGVIDKFVGDEVMVIFAAGQETEAVRAAIDILEAIDANPDVNMTVGIGVHSGDAVVGSIGTADRRDYTAIGDTINIGARICAACPPDSAYVSAAVFKCLPLAMQLRLSAHETLRLKGKTEPIEVHLFTLNKDRHRGDRDRDAHR
jgi:class 3 adenylate cyclase